MPSQYAHYRFGAQLISQMPDPVRRTVQRFRRLYDVGLHGPDLFFYHNILFQDAAGQLARRFHRQTGTEFFTRVCAQLRQSPSEADLAYLYGVLAHYCLDCRCHPFIEQLVREEKAGHMELEKEFDRSLLVLDGHLPPHTYDYTRHMKLTAGECAAAAGFYPPATAAMVSRSVASMAACCRLLSSPRGLLGSAVNGVIRLTGGKYAKYRIPHSPDPVCAQFDSPLQALYDLALDAYPRLLSQLLAHLDHGAPLGPEFEKAFD